MTTKKKIVVATYEDLESAQKVVAGLIAADFDRDDIYLARRTEESDTPTVEPAVYEGTQGPHALVALTLLQEKVEYAQNLMIQRSTPILVEVGDAPLKLDDWRDLIPNLDEFNPVSLDFGDVEAPAME